MKAKDLIIRERREDTNPIIARNKEEFGIARKLVKEYVDSLSADLNVSLEYDNIDHELEHLKKHYGPPTGLILLAKNGDEFVGVTCIRSLDHHIAEIKRMFVQPDHRGKGLGRLMLKKAMNEARKLGYKFIRLDTVPDMESAIKLYLSEGFYEIEDYTYNPYLGARFMEYKL